MNAMHDLRDMLCKELDEITMKGGLNGGDLDAVDKLTHSIKSIDTIMAMQESGSYNNGGYMRNGYNRSYSARQRDSRGRYMTGYRNYRDGGKEHMMDMLHDMMNDAQDENIRRAIGSAISQIEQG